MTQIINVGSAPNDGTGDLLRNAFIKVNANFLSASSSITNLQVSSASQSATIALINIDIDNLQVTAASQSADITVIESDITLIESDIITLGDDIDNLASIRVPYTGATSDVNLGEFGIQLGNLEFDNTPTNIPTTVGSMYYNNTDGTLDLKLKGGNVTLQIGQESVVRVVNKTSTNITLLEANYQAVRLTGAQGQRLKVDLAQATTDSLSAETIGLVTETIANNQEGFVTTSGIVRNINTTGSLQGETWLDGDVLYLSPTVAGNVTKVKTVAPNHLVIIGYVISAHVTQGSIFVKVDNGYELDELHNVLITSESNNEGLFYETSTSLWKNKSIATVLGYTASNDSTVVHITGNETIAGIKTFSTAPILSSLTASQLLALGASKNIQTLDTTVYPSLTELAFVKGATSNLQTQINAFSLVSGLLAVEAQLTYLDMDYTIFDAFYSRIIADGGTIESTSQLLSTLANLRSISYTAQSYIQQFNADKFVKLGGTTEQYLMADGKALSNIATNSTTSNLSLATLNSTYPTAIIGFRVHCILITAQKLIYEKTSTGWVSYSINQIT
jgi:hypothetical protein